MAIRMKKMKIKVEKLIYKALSWIFTCTFCGRIIPDKTYLEIKYKNAFGKKIRWKNPLTYNEKLQWLKLYDRKDIYTKMVDKYEVKKIVAKIIGEDYLVPTIGVWDRFNDIEFDKLPNSFVLKCTHDSGSAVICKDKSKFDRKNAEQIITKSLKKNYYWFGREWAYKNVRPRIMVEKYLGEGKDGDLKDYKFFCFNGEVKALFVAQKRQIKEMETEFDFFDSDYNHLSLTNGHPNAVIPPEKPLMFDLMKKLAMKLAKGIPHVRIDFYESDGKVYFGEMTFFHWSGFMPFYPEKWDDIFGGWISLPKGINK